MDNLHQLAAKYFENSRGITLITDEETETQRAIARRKAGRYTLEEAAFFIAEKGPARAHEILNGLMDAIADRTLTIYEPGLNGVYKSDIVRPWSDEAYWYDLNNWLEEKQSNIGRIFTNPDGTKAATKTEVNPGATTTPRIIKNKLRTNSLDPAIKKAIQQAGNVELADVYLQLKELAKDEEPPFTGVFDGDALCYTNDRNEDAKLSKEALGKRLKNRR